MLDRATQNQLKSYLERLQAPVELVASVDGGTKSESMLEMLREIAELSPRVSLREDGSDERVPSFSVGQPGQPARIRFAGLPMGHEFPSLILALLQTGGHPPKVDESILEQIRSLEGPFRFETYISLSCHNCPDVVQALNLLAVVNPRIEAVMIDGALFQEEIEQRQIMAVPTVFANGEPFGQGRMVLEEIIAKLDSGALARQARELSRKEPFDVLIVGGGPAGAAAAIYAARKGLRTGVVAERFGGQVLDTLAIENLISVAYTEGPTLAAAVESQVREHEVDIMNLQRARALIAPGADGLVAIELEGGAELKSRSVILATGARWREMNVPGEAQYRGRGVAYCPHCDGPLFKGKRVAVIGGGNSGVEAAIDLAGVVAHVTLLEFDNSLRADAVLCAKLASLANVTVLTGALTTAVLGDGERVRGLVYRERASQTDVQLELEGVFVQIGLLPNTDWLRASVALSARGEIEVDARGQTSVPGVFAAGDATTTPYKQIVIAMGDGAKASLSAFDYLIRSSAPAAPEVAIRQTEFA